MAWLVNSIATSLTIDDDDDDDDFNPETTNFTAATPIGANPPSQTPNPNHTNYRQIESYDESTPRRGVKDDHSELSDTFSRQLWGVASFLAPPPPPQISDRDRNSDYSDAGFRNDLSRNEENFPGAMSSVGEYDLEEEVSVEDCTGRGVVGVTEEVVAFARGIALHPETWIDFPLPDDDVDEDFELSDAQQDHVLAIERLAPELAAVRIELCLSYMSEGCFWKIYFALVHPRLSRHDAEILSTPEIVKARAMLSQELHSHSKSKPYESGSSNIFSDHTTLALEEHSSFPVFDQFEHTPIEISSVGPTPSLEADVEMDKHAIVSTEIPIIDKKVVEEVSTEHKNIEKPTTIISRFIDQKYEDDDEDDDWLEQVNAEAGPLQGTSYPPGDYDDISFSDLEDDEDIPSNYKKVKNPNEKVSSDTLKNKGSIDWLDTKNIGIA